MYVVKVFCLVIICKVQVRTAEVGNSLMQFVLSLYTSFQV